ncbi:MAG: hypothetical protein HC890_16180 [Chloroflexaceae bacterium]|nr:hypothetical protein [Chloroflexaceae bacterium]
MGAGEVIFRVDGRAFFPPGSVEESGTAVYYTGGFTWGITNSTELTLAFQHVDSGSGILDDVGDFDLVRTDDNEAALELKQRLWQNDEETLILSGILGLSIGPRGFAFSGNGELVEEDSFEVIPALQLPLTASGDRWQATIAPTLAFFQEDSTGFLPTLPVDDPGEYGTTFGFAGAVAYNVNPRLTLWGDAFIPVTGNNSLGRDSGQPESTIAFNAGLRYLVNPRVALDLFASNALGSVGPTALTADPDFTGVGASVVFLPELIGANRRYADTFNPPGESTPLTVDGLAFFDGGTVPGGKVVLNAQGGTNGSAFALRYGFVEDLEVGVYLDLVAGQVDESEQGISGKVRLLNQNRGDLVTASLAATFGLPNQPFINFTTNNANSFDDRNLDEDVPFLFQGDNEAEGQLFIVTVSLPITYQFESGAALWVTPIVGFVQRNGTELAGFNLGGSLPVVNHLSAIAEVGANFAGEGNAFLDDELGDAIPWTVGVRWDPSAFLGLNPNARNRPSFELYVTNRVGSSTWHQLRVRESAEPAVGVGLTVPF